jgi:putative transposase
MIMEICLNMLIETEENKQSGEIEHLVERIVGILPDNETIFTMNIEGNKGFPIARSRTELVQSYEDGVLRVLTADPYFSFQKEEAISESQKQQRDLAWDIVQQVLTEAGQGIYFSDIRGDIISKIALKNKTSQKTLYSYLRRYWQRGCHKNAMLPDYSNSGGRGRRRLSETEFSTKLGRPSLRSRISGENKGIRISKRIEQIFSLAINKFYLNRKQYSFKTTYEKMLFHYFKNGYEQIDGVLVPVMPPDNELPSLDQFYYWYKKHCQDKIKEQRSRRGDNEFNLNLRELKGDSTSLASGPGAVFMIDATIADVYLVSGFDRKRIIGRPVIYFVVDVFSRMITGFAVTLEGPSWAGASLALDNMVADKVEVCSKLGINIKPEDWNCHNLPEAIIADRGEFESHAANILVDIFNIRIHNTAPYRGDLKGIVERLFGIANEKFIRFLPGAVVKNVRGEKPKALDAMLTLQQFREMLVIHILHYNQNHLLSAYRPHESLIADNVPLFPQAIWNWGIQNKSGRLHTMPRDIVRLNLLPRKAVSINRHGIRFYGDIYYERPKEISYGTKRVEIVFDPNCLDSIFIPTANGKNALITHLTPACKPLYQERSYQEVQDYFAVKKQLSATHSANKLQAEALFRAREEDFVSRAIQETNEVLSTTENRSNRARLKGMRENRKDEKEQERISNSLSPMKSEKALPSFSDSSIPIITEEETNIRRPSYKNLITEVIKEKQK